VTGEVSVNIDEYKRRLLAEEQRLLSRMGRAGTEARESTDDAVHDAGEASVGDILKEEEFTEADVDWRTLGQVRDALRRIEEGKFGRCLVDGGPIEEERLRAVPWTPLCAKHARLREASRGQRTPTL
jgi:RNA polymerase-binding transcription factor